MLKIALIFYFNIASIMAVGTNVCEILETYFEWKVDKFFDLPTAVGYVVDSPKFTFANSNWSLRIYPNGQTKYPEYISVFLRVSDPEEEYPVDFKLGFKRTNGSDFKAYNTTHIFSTLSSSWGWAQFIKRSELLSSKDALVPKGTLTVFCQVRIVNKNEVIPDIMSSNGVLTLTDDLKDLYTSRRYTDVSLFVKDRKFSAHKNILSSRLPAFRSMLGKIPDTVNITDCDPDSFEEFLLFVYTGKLQNVSTKKAMNLYLTADKYTLPELKKECTRSLVEQDLNVDSFNDILRFAILQNDTELLKKVTDYFISYAKYIILKENWKTFLKEYPLQGNELFLKYIEKKN